MSKCSILYKLTILFLFISVIPLVIFEFVSSQNLSTTAENLMKKNGEMGRDNLHQAQVISSIAIENAVAQLDAKGTEALELRTVELADRIADFLTERDNDALSLAQIPPEPNYYLGFYKAKKKSVIIGVDPDMECKSIPWKNPNNKTSWHHVPPIRNKTVLKPIYKEITFIDLGGQERIKIKNGKVSQDLQDVSIKENTYCKAEDYFSHAGQLKQNELYVSKVIGAYVRGWLTKENGHIKVQDKSAYAGRENPNGKRFEGIVRWVTPVYQQNRKIGYLTLALDHVHLMEFTDHVVPTDTRFTAIPDASTGNYAFLWDSDHQSISHPRQFFICGYDSATGKEVPGWLSQDTYNEFTKSSLPLNEFIAQLPDFKNFSSQKKGSNEQLLAGTVGADCRVLDHAPQCEGWSRGTADGGSGSFLIFWSGLWKLTTYAAIPYHTGQYAQSPRGFGYVTIGANIDDFHKAASSTKKRLEDNLAKQKQNISAIQSETQRLINSNIARQRQQSTLIFIATILSVVFAAVFLGLKLTKPLRQLSKGVQAVGEGDYDQMVDVTSCDEIGQLAQSFNKMAHDIKKTNERLRDEINERLKAEKALILSEKQYHDIFEFASEGIFQTTFAGDLINANPRMASMFGYDSAAEMIETVTDVAVQFYVDQKQREKFLKQLLENNTVYDFETKMYTKQREVIWISISARIVYNDNNPEYIEGFILDRNEKKAAEQVKEELQERLARSKKMEALGLLAGGVAHDLNNVLAGIVGYPQLLKMRLPEDSPLQKQLTVIQESGKKAADIVQDLLTLARRGVSTTETVNLNELIQEELPSLEQMIEERRNPELTLRPILAPDLLCIKGSPVHLKKTLMNLVSNALEACSRGEITILTENKYIDTPLNGYDEIKEGEYVLLEVRDNGAGIDSENLKRIFEPFFTTKTMGRSGTGLGMSVVWGTVQDHNGYINAESSIGGGTTISLYFPATREPHSTVVEEIRLADYTGNGESILIVDDMKEQRELAEALLTKLNYKTHSVPSGEEAIRYLEKHDVSLVILDMIMPPGMDGLETYQHILKLHPGQKAIIASGFSENERVNQAQHLGAGEYVKKPYTVERIGLAVKRELERPVSPGF